MLYSLFLTLILLSPFSEKVNFTLLNDSSEVISIAVENMPELTLHPEGSSQLRLSKNETVYYVTNTENYKRIALFEVDESLEGKQIKLKKLIHQVKKDLKD